MLSLRMLVFCAFALVGLARTADAQTLSQRAIYERCFSKLVRTTPADNDALAMQVSAGSKTGAQACKELLQLAKFAGNGSIPAYSGNAEKRKLAQQVLHSMNDLHMSWFARKRFEGDNQCRMDVTASLIDATEPALFVTRALFDSAVGYDSVVTNKVNLRAVREVDNPLRSIINPRIVGPFEGFPAGQRMISNGGIVGIRTGFNPNVNLRAPARAPGETTTYAANNYKLFENQGGGILGSQAYILNNFGEDDMLFSNLEIMPRLWAKHVFEDLLCRQLPVIKDTDATPYQVCPTCAIKPTAAERPHVLPFRQDRSCVQCHASMDQILGVVRNFRGARAGACTFGNAQNPTPRFAAIGWVQQPPTLAASGAWGYLPDDNYRKRPPRGRFLYRNYKDGLINKPVNDLADLGNTLAATEDLYICAAKRYYRYFTGIDADVTPMTTAEANALPPDRKFYRNRVINLGVQFSKTSGGYGRDPMKLIEAIFDLPEFKKKDFDMEAKASQ